MTVLRERRQGRAVHPGAHARARGHRLAGTPGRRLRGVRRADLRRADRARRHPALPARRSPGEDGHRQHGELAGGALARSSTTRSSSSPRRSRSYLKLRGWTQKYLLRRAMRGLLPDAVLRRPKMGFGVPIDHWFRHELREMAYDVLLDARARQRGYFRPESSAAIWTSTSRGARHHHSRLWSLLMLEQWHRVFIDTRPAYSGGASGVRGLTPAAAALRCPDCGDSRRSIPRRSRRVSSRPRAASAASPAARTIPSCGTCPASWTPRPATPRASGSSGGATTCSIRRRIARSSSPRPAFARVGPRGPARPGCRLRQRSLRCGRGRSRGAGRRGRRHRRRRAGARGLCGPGRRPGRSGRPPPAAVRARRRSIRSTRSASSITRPTRGPPSMPWSACSSPGAGSRSGSTGGTRACQEAVNSALRAVARRLSDRALHRLARRRGRGRRHPAGAARQPLGAVFLASGLADPRVRHLRLVRAALPAPPHDGRGRRLVSAPGGSRTSDRSAATCPAAPATTGSTTAACCRAAASA